MVNVYAVILTRPITFEQADTMGMVCLCCLPIPHADITAYLAVVAIRGRGFQYASDAIAVNPLVCVGYELSAKNPIVAHVPPQVVGLVWVTRIVVRGNHGEICGYVGVRYR